MPSVAIITPVYREALSPDEDYAIRHLRRHLSGYDCYQMSPQSLAFRIDGLEVRKYEDRWFTGVDAYSELLLSKSFYEAFAEYDYILIYQLDCLVFRDELQYWCEQGYDYIGAPFAISKEDPALGFSRVGNGGFSLRRVQAFIDVLDPRKPKPSSPRFLRALWTRLPDLAHLPWVARWWKTLRVLRDVRVGVESYVSSYRCNEDLFWSDRARLFDSNFDIAPLPVGFQFAFEMWPQQCDQITGGKLPFGTHAWQKCDRLFWEPYLLT